MNDAIWVVVEGGDGAGKGVASGVVREALDARSMPYIATREPGGTPEGEKLRALLLSEAGSVWEKTSEIMLMTTSRVQHVARVIRPSLARGVSVLCDRYVHSSIAYQGYGQQGSVDFIMDLHRTAVGGDMPDLTILLDIDPEIGIPRAKGRLAAQQVDEGRMENLDMAFHRRVRTGYLEIAAADPDRHMVVDASRTIAKVGDDIRARLSEWLDARTGPVDGT